MDNISKYLDYLSQDYGSYYDVLDGTAVQKRAEEVWDWIVEHPNYRFPKYEKGWLNFIKTQFCKWADLITPEEILKCMFDEGVLYKDGGRVYINTDF